MHDELQGIMTFPHGGRKHVNGGQHLVEAVRLIREEYAGIKLKPSMYKFRNKLMRVCVCVRNARQQGQAGTHRIGSPQQADTPPYVCEFLAGLHNVTQHGGSKHLVSQ